SHLALGTSHSALGTRHLALRTQHSALSTLTSTPRKCDFPSAFLRTRLRAARPFLPNRRLVTCRRTLPCRLRLSAPIVLQPEQPRNPRRRVSPAALPRRLPQRVERPMQQLALKFLQRAPHALRRLRIHPAAQFLNDLRARRLSMLQKLLCRIRGL